MDCLPSQALLAGPAASPRTTCRCIHFPWGGSHLPSQLSTKGEHPGGQLLVDPTSSLLPTQIEQDPKAQWEARLPYLGAPAKPLPQEKGPFIHTPSISCEGYSVLGLGRDSDRSLPLWGWADRCALGDRCRKTTLSLINSPMKSSNVTLTELRVTRAGHRTEARKMGRPTQAEGPGPGSTGQGARR